MIAMKGIGGGGMQPPNHFRLDPRFLFLIHSRIYPKDIRISKLILVFS